MPPAGAAPPHRILTPALDRSLPVPQVTQLSPAGSKLAGCKKSNAALAASLGAKTTALSRCTATTASLNKQLM